MLLQQIILLLTAHKYLFLFPAAVVEGPIVTVIAGFLSSLGIFNIFIAYAVVVVSDIVGDIMHMGITEDKDSSNVGDVSLALHWNAWSS